MLNKKALSDNIGQFMRRYSPAIITLIVMAAAFYFYSHVIIQRNENTIKERSFRGLSRMAGNIREKIIKYAGQNSRNFSNQVKALKGSDALKMEMEQARLQEEYGLEADSNNTVAGSQDSFYFRFGHQNQIVFPSDSMEALAAVQSFVHTILRKDLFPYYFLAHNNKVLFDELNPSNDTIKPLAAGEEVLDTNKLATIAFSRIMQVETGGIRYKLFMVPFGINGNHQFVIGAYMPEEKYLAESRYIPGIAIMWLVFGIVLVVLMFPLLKVLLMNKVEPLLPRNVITSLISLHIMGSILILILVNLYSYYFLVRDRADDQLKQFNIQVYNTFQQEVKDAVDEIDNAEKELINLVNTQYDHLGAHPKPDLYGNVADATFYLRPDENGVHPPYRTQFLGRCHPYFDRIVWIDTSGNQFIRWANGKNFAPEINVRDRGYFKAVLGQNLFRSNDKEYYLGAVSSWVSKKKLAIIARPSHLPQLASQLTIEDPVLRDTLQQLLNKAKVVSFSSELKSVFGPVLPHGLGFCMVDLNGEVIFHSNPDRSLNENLIKECNEDAGLTAMFSTGTEIYFNAPYGSSNYRFFIRPVSGMPFYLVTFYDNQYLWNFDLDVVSASSIMVLMNMAAILVLVVFARLLSFRLLSRSVLFIWIEPKSHRWTAYLKATMVFVAAFLLTVAFVTFSASADDLYLLCMSLGYTHIVITYAYFLYNRSDDSAIESGLPDTSPQLVQEKQSAKSWFARNLHPFYVLVASYVAGLAVILSLLKSNTGYFLLSQGLLIIVVLGVFLFEKRWRAWSVQQKEQKQRGIKKKSNLEGTLLGWVKENFTRQRYKVFYYWSSFSFILATAIVPAFLFYVLSFREEQKLVLKFQQLDMVNNVMSRQAPFQRFLDTGAVLSYHIPVYGSTLFDRFQYSDHWDTMSRRSTSFGSLYSLIKPSFSTYARQVGYMNVESELPSGFMWVNAPPDDTMVLKMDMFRKKGIVPDKQANQRLRLLALKKIPTVYGQFMNMIGKYPVTHFLLLLIVLAILMGLCWLLVGLIAKVFFFGKPAVMPTEELGATFTSGKPRVYHAYLLGIVNSGKYRKIHQTFQHHIIHEFDIAWLIPGTVTEGAKPQEMNNKWDKILNDLNACRDDKQVLQKHVVVIRHFEMKMDDINITAAKLKKMEELLAYKFVQVVISSSRHYDAMPLTDEKTGQDYTDRWANVMNNFCTFYHRFPEKYEISVASCTSGHAGVNALFTKELDELFRSECLHSNYLVGLLNPVKLAICEAMQPWGAKKMAGKVVPEYYPADLAEIFYQKLEKLAYHYYLSLWQSVNVDEQRTLYDIASDGLMNQSNQEVANDLYAMGLLRINTSESGFSIMNESFRRFILTRLDKSEISKLHDGTAPDHSWNRFQLPIIIVVIAVSLFLIVTQKEAFNNMVAWLGAVAGGIAALLRLLDLVPGSKATNT